MEFQFAGDHSAEAANSPQVAGSFSVEAEVLHPIMEGARARGVADAFDLIGQGAILLNAAGGVLHVTEAAKARLGQQITVCAGHLVARTESANHAVQELLEALLDRGTRRESVELSAEAGFPPLRISGLAFAPGSRSDYQLLAVVLLIGDSTLNPAGISPGTPESSG